jgi:hypothetical protein
MISILPNESGNVLAFWVTFVLPILEREVLEALTREAEMRYSRPGNGVEDPL